MDWLIFFGIIAVLLSLDLWGFDRKDEVPSITKALLRTGLYTTVAFGFGAWIYLYRGADAGLQFITGYSLEMSLSFDNVFVISLILAALSIPPIYRSRVLFVGILGAIILRGAFIVAGAAIVGQFRFVLIGFGAFLIYTGIKMLRNEGEPEVSIEDNRTLKLLRRVLPISLSLDGHKLFVRGSVTPLFIAIVLVEIADVVFATDSIPATFAITTDPFIVMTSNIFAVIGLRSLFFVLEAMVDQFKYLGMALSAVLVFIGAKVLAAELLHLNMSTPISLAIVLGMLAGGVGISVLARRGKSAVWRVW